MSKKISVKQEPEIQFDAQSLETLNSVEQWLISCGAKLTKEVKENSPYFDTKNNRLIREGIECRLKKKKGAYRTDLKTPINLNERSVCADDRGIIWRHEICAHTSAGEPDLKQFSQVPTLTPLKNRISGIFDKSLIIKFRAQLEKRKFERTIGHGEDKSLIEYSLQKGHMVTPDGTRKSSPLFIVEVELREGSENALISAIEEFENNFPELGLLPERKVMIGFKLIQPDMSDKAKKKFSKLETFTQRNPSLEAA